MTVTLAHASGWTVAGVPCPAVYLDRADLEELYQALGFSIIESRSVELEGRSQYDGFHMISGRRTAAI